MNEEKAKECILFMLCRSGIYPFPYESPILIFFEKLMKKDKLDLNIPCCGNELFEYLYSIIEEMEYCKDIRKRILDSWDMVYTPLRDYDSKILSKDEVFVLEEILYDMIKESRKMDKLSQDSIDCVDSIVSNILH